MTSEYIHHNRKLNISINFRCDLYDKFFLQSVTSHTLDSYPVAPYCLIGHLWTMTYFMDGPFQPFFIGHILEAQNHFYSSCLHFSVVFFISSFRHGCHACMQYSSHGLTNRNGKFCGKFHKILWNENFI